MNCNDYKNFTYVHVPLERNKIHHFLRRSKPSNMFDQSCTGENVLVEEIDVNKHEGRDYQIFYYVVPFAPLAALDVVMKHNLEHKL
jgi:hypothetical protein